MQPISGAPIFFLLLLLLDSNRTNVNVLSNFYYFNVTKGEINSGRNAFRSLVRYRSQKLNFFRKPCAEMVTVKYIFTLLSLFSFGVQHQFGGSSFGVDGINQDETVLVVV